MLTILLSLFSSARQVFQTRAALQAEILALRHQLLVLQRSSRGHRLRLSRADRFLWRRNLHSGRPQGLQPRALGSGDPGNLQRAEMKDRLHVLPPMRRFIDSEHHHRG